MKQGTPREVTIEGANICCRATWYQASVTWQIGVAVIEASRCSMTALEAGGKGKKIQKYDLVCGFRTPDFSNMWRFRKKTQHITVLIHKQEFFLLHTKKFLPFLFVNWPFFQEHLRLSWVFIVQRWSLSTLLPLLDKVWWPWSSRFVGFLQKLSCVHAVALIISKKQVDTGGTRHRYMTPPRLRLVWCFLTTLESVRILSCWVSLSQCPAAIRQGCLGLCQRRGQEHEMVNDPYGTHTFSYSY